jgi:hypothetical protein
MYRAFALGLICVTVDVHLSGWLFGGEFSL